MSDAVHTRETTSTTTSTKGIVRPGEVGQAFELRRFPPAPALEPFVERYWAVHWDRRGREPYPVRLISQPCVNITFTHDSAILHGVGTGTSTHLLDGVGRTFGVKFRPGGYAAFAGRSAVGLTDRSLPLASALEVDEPTVERLTGLVRDAEDSEAVRHLDSHLTELLPAQVDDTYHDLLRMISMLLRDRTITRVAHLSVRSGISVRTLQRQFRHYLGVGPKWLIRRYRLHDGAESLATDPRVDPAQLSVELGWFDQAHFTRDFAALLGTSPMAYAAACRRADSPFYDGT